MSSAQQNSQQSDQGGAQGTPRTRRVWTTEQHIFICALKVLSNRSWAQITAAFNRRFNTNEKWKNVSSQFQKTLNPWEKIHPNYEYRRVLEAWKNGVCERGYRWLIDEAHEIVEREDELDGRDPGTVLMEEDE